MKYFSERVMTGVLFLILAVFSAYFVIAKEGGSEDMTMADPVQENLRPPIDLAAPDSVETATFALG
jgi:hypothetical protein